MLKKIISSILALTILLSAAFFFASCEKEDGSKELEGTLPEILASVYEKATSVAFRLNNSEISLTDENAVPYAIGLAPGSAELAQISAVYSSEPMMTSQAYSLILLTVKPDGDVDAVKQAIFDSINPRKWICVAAEKVIVTNCGHTVMLVMTEAALADEIYTAFSDICGDSVGAKLEKQGE